jgi:hypothetical protein
VRAVFLAGLEMQRGASLVLLAFVGEVALNSLSKQQLPLRQSKQSV